MIRFLQLVILTVGLFIFSCEERKTETVNINEKAKELIDEIDSVDLGTLQHLHFVYRGPSGFWQNDSIEESRYNLQFSRGDITLELIIHGPERFINDFSINLEYDTSLFNLKLVKSDNEVQIYKNWDKLIKVVHSDSLSKKDPFEFISNLNDLKNKYELVKITHHSHLGQFVEFYFTTADVLTYVPDSSNINPQFKSIWTKKWDKGQWINRNWNLRKLEKPIEVGG
ncbi:hypothetical protein [Echinicola salinicaeni]|uniref:hypothetical protein n=1 Tax=Echinicola salinicaeni TaxID=2762757 RepID=UPI0016454DE2|nr:hypothetical protein [Echinicola salinicaeni]